jgi:hypothetical protein
MTPREESPSPIGVKTGERKGRVTTAEEVAGVSIQKTDTKELCIFSRFNKVRNNLEAREFIP